MKQTILIIISIVSLSSCGHGDLYYLRAQNKLMDAEHRRDRALDAAALDAHSFASIEMIKEITTALQEHNKEIQEDTNKINEATKSWHPINLNAKDEYERELEFYNKINSIARSYGFKEYAPDFDPDR